MSYNYGRKSSRNFKTLHPYLQVVFLRTLLVHDHSQDQGGRTRAEQLAAYNRGASTLKPPKGEHLLRKDPTGRVPGLWSFATDCTPFINGRRLATRGRAFGPEQMAQFARFLGIVEQNGRDVLLGTGWHLRFGTNWDEDAEILTDQNFDDWFHVEMVRDAA